MTVQYHSKNGDSLPFMPYHYYGPWIPNIGGIYIFAIYKPYLHVWVPLYIGKAKSFKDRFVNHHKWQAAFDKGVRQVLAVRVDDERLRSILEAEMIREFDPVLNEKTPLTTFLSSRSLTTPTRGLLSGDGKRTNHVGLSSWLTPTNPL